MIVKPLQTIPSEDGSISSAEYRVVPMKSERKRQRSVSFNQIVSHNEVLHVNNYNKDERGRTWYSREEFASMKIQCQVTVDLIEHGVISEDCENYCITGLEHRISSPTNITRKTRREKGIDAVLEEQAEQNYIGLTDAEAISVAYVEAISEPETKRNLAQSPAVANAVRKQRRRITKPLSRMIRNRMRRRKDNQ